MPDRTPHVLKSIRDDVRSNNETLQRHEAVLNTLQRLAEQNAEVLKDMRLMLHGSVSRSENASMRLANRLDDVTFRLEVCEQKLGIKRS